MFVLLRAESACGMEKGDWITRLRALYLHPNDRSGSVSTIPHSGVSVSNAWTPELDISYMFTKNLGLELILATSYHKLDGKGVLSGTRIGTTWLLPPVLTLQYHFFPEEMVQPYVGVGGNFSYFYKEHCSLAHTHLHLSSSWGPAVNAGVDICFTRNRKWFFNFDVKYVWIYTKAHLHGQTAGTVGVHIDPWIFGLGIGRRW
jgi:outer membrane protein